jgi:hypothetical protein
MTAAPVLRPIPTRYKGYHFRSRLEARWAVFFEVLGVAWEYEPQGFDIDGTKYLPDFRVQTGDLVCWYEIKPRGSKGCKKFATFADMIEHQDPLDDGWRPRAFNVEARLFFGDPADQFIGKHACPRCGRDVEPDHDFWVDGVRETGFLCVDCDDVTACGGGNPWELGWAGIPFYPHKGWIMTSTANYAQLMANVGRACTAARSARFEHGESGAT